MVRNSRTSPEVQTALVQRQEDHSQAHAAAASSSAHYQAAFVAAHNSLVGAKPFFKQGDFVALKLRNPRTNKGISTKSLKHARTFAVILEKDRAHKYLLYTSYGILQDRVNANSIEPAADVN